ncbi:MAG: transglutaminase family protein [Gemmatimonadales bacterium]
MSRRTLAGAIIFLWLGALGWLVRRQHREAPSRLIAEAALRIPPGAAYLSLELGNRTVGFLSTKVDTLPDTLQVQSLLMLDVPTPDGPKRIESRTNAALSRQMSLRTFESAVRGYEGEFATFGEVLGDTLLNLEIESTIGRHATTVPLNGPVILPSMLPVYLAFGAKPGVGDTLALDLFDPLNISQRSVTVAVVAESSLIVPDSATYDSVAARWVEARWDTLRAWRITQARADGSEEFSAWIDELGQLVRSSYPSGATLDRSAFEIAFERFQEEETSGRVPAEDDSNAPVRRTPLASGIRLDGELSLLRARLSGPGLGDLNVDGGGQHLHGDTLTVHPLADSTMRPRYGLPAQQPSLRPYLQPEPLIQSDDARIAARARLIVARLSRRRRRNPALVARALNRWVSEQIKPDVAHTVPSALVTLDTRSGDGNGHAVLLVALARALGLPARIAAGLVYAGGKFYYHAWAEIYLNGWVRVDPTFGQYPADAAHIRFSTGGLARQMELIGLVGQLQLHVIKADQAK